MSGRRKKIAKGTPVQARVELSNRRPPVLGTKLRSSRRKRYQPKRLTFESLGNHSTPIRPAKIPSKKRKRTKSISSRMKKKKRTFGRKFHSIRKGRKNVLATRKTKTFKQKRTTKPLKLKKRSVSASSFSTWAGINPKLTLDYKYGEEEEEEEEEDDDLLMDFSEDEISYDPITDSNRVQIITNRNNQYAPHTKRRRFIIQDSDSDDMNHSSSFDDFANVMSLTVSDSESSSSDPDEFLKSKALATELVDDLSSSDMNRPKLRKRARVDYAALSQPLLDEESSSTPDAYMSEDAEIERIVKIAVQKRNGKRIIQGHCTFHGYSRKHDAWVDAAEIMRTCPELFVRHILTCLSRDRYHRSPRMLSAMRRMCDVFMSESFQNYYNDVDGPT